MMIKTESYKIFSEIYCRLIQLQWSYILAMDVGVHIDMPTKEWVTTQGPVSSFFKGFRGIGIYIYIDIIYIPISLKP